jgi:hypothetical protein
MVDVYSYVVDDLVPEVLHKRIEHVIVLLNRIFRFQDEVHSVSAPCDNGKSSRWHGVQ